MRCHTALKEVRHRFDGIKWLYKRDISGCFDNIEHGILISLLRKRIQDERFLNLIYKLLKCNILKEFRIFETSIRGTPQGGIVSPILANIYLHELDEFVNELITNFNRGVRRQGNPEYLRLKARMVYHKKKGKMIEYQRLRKLRRTISPRLSKDPKYRVLRYVRYADDYLIGIVASRKEAVMIVKKIQSFLLEKLLLKGDSGRESVVRATKGKITFLGVEIRNR